jgi:hypothetical protein
MGKLPPDKKICEKLNEYLYNAESELPHILPLVKDCCFRYGWNHKDLYERAKKSPQVKHCLDRLLYRLEVAVVNFSLMGVYNARMAAYMLDRLTIWEQHDREVSALDLLDKQLVADERLAHSLVSRFPEAGFTADDF